MLQIDQQIHDWYVCERLSLYDIARKLAVPLTTVRQIAQEKRWVWSPLQDFIRTNRGADAIVFDLETSGLPTTRGFNKYYPYTENRAYSSSRILQLAYCRYQFGSGTVSYDTIQSSYRCPDDFEISEESLSIHQLSLEYLQQHGQSIREVLKPFLEELRSCTYIVAHNALFDVNILKNELFRLGYSSTEIETLLPDHKICCTCKLTDFTRLGVLYSLLPTEIVDARKSIQLHNAQDDVYALTQIINFLATDNKSIQL